MSQSDLTAEDKPAVDATPAAPTGPQRGARDPRLVRIGLYIAGFGFLFAMVMAAILGFLTSRNAGQYDTLETIHRIALMILLAGMTVVLFGYVRFESVQRRWGGR